MQKLNSIKNKIPLPVRLFLGKALLFFILWKLVYGFFLFDSLVIDKVLTKHVGDTSAFILNNGTFLSGFTSVLESVSKEYAGETLDNLVATIYRNGKTVLHIAGSCNGLELLILYAGFIICMPSSFKRKMIYLVLGVISLDLINIFRCVGLIYVYEYFQVYFNFAHHFLFKAIVYMSTFFIWMFFTRKINLNDKPV